MLSGALHFTCPPWRARPQFSYLHDVRYPAGGRGKPDPASGFGCSCGGVRAGYRLPHRQTDSASLAWLPLLAGGLARLRRAAGVRGIAARWRHGTHIAGAVFWEGAAALACYNLAIRCEAPGGLIRTLLAGAAFWLLAAISASALAAAYHGVLVKPLRTLTASPCAPSCWPWAPYFWAGRHRGEIGRN